MTLPLREGVYEHPITLELQRGLEGIPADRRQIESIDDEESAAVVARHLATEVERVLGGIKAEGRSDVARILLDHLLAEIADFARTNDQDFESVIDQGLTSCPKRLLSIHKGTPPVRPATPLSISTLLTRNRTEPSLANEIAAELATADRVDVIIAFVTVGGVRLLSDVLEEFSLRGDGLRFRMLTTVFTGTTEPEAVDRLSCLPGAQLKVSYDVRRTRLHAKAWLFHRQSGLSTAYIGSANLTATALGGGQEWMVKVCAADLPQVIEKFQGTFESLWEDPEFEAYDPKDEGARTRLRKALRAERSPDKSSTSLVTIRPLPFQEVILEQLRIEREVHGRRRNLIVAATGTGKTVIAACDYVRVSIAAAVRPRLLFLAHRKEILLQARDTFRHALQDGSFGEILADGEKPERCDYVFATIQGLLAGDFIGRLGREHFRHVVIDECHHLPAPSYQTVIQSISPDLMIGLTATPERSDGKSLLPDFGGHIAHELRLWQALDQQLLVPFEYFGVSDLTDLRNIRWTRSGYDQAALSNLYTGNDARAALVLKQLERRVADVRAVRALGFCVSIEHASFMARKFSSAGIPAMAVHGESDSEDRAQAATRLRERDVNVLFTCDLYNEGVDLPFVDTLLLLRPTQSATLFMQQLGRGLRHHERKASCLVLDFIGQQNERFRFDTLLSAMTGVPRSSLRKALESGFSYLPSGCTLQLDRVARDTILRSLQTLGGARAIVPELRELSPDRSQLMSMRNYLNEANREVAEIYRAGGWTTLLRQAGLVGGDDSNTNDLSARLQHLLHVDDAERLSVYASAVSRLAAAGSPPATLSVFDRTRIQMLDSQLWDRGEMATAEQTVAKLAENPLIVAEFQQLQEVLSERATDSNLAYPNLAWPIGLHRHYTRREIVAAVGFVQPGQKKKSIQGGILKLENVHSELLFVTLDKSGTGFSPTTRYRDYAISRDLFHWETQAAASASRASGRRYIESPGNGMTFHLFVRSTKEDPFAYLGPVRYQSHTGDRPIAVTWRLDYRLPAALFEKYATLVPG